MKYLQLLASRRPNLAEQTKQNQEEEQHFLSAAIKILAISAAVLFFFPGLLPFKILDVWKSSGTITQWLTSSWGIFAWGGGVTALICLLTKNSQQENALAELNFGKGMVISVLAGLLEEISFRWAMFYGAMLVGQLVNWLFFGWAGFGLVQWLHLGLFGPVANFFTLGILQEQLLSTSTWYVGAGILAANARFRDGHKYLGLLGYINSWFIGMFMFYLMFRFGLLAAIVIHFLYDLLIFFVRYLDQAIERSQES